MILHLLFSFKSLLAFYCSTFEFVLVMNKNIVLLDLCRRFKSRIANFAGLHESLDTTFVPKVRTAQFQGLVEVRVASRCWTFVVRVSDADEQYFMLK
jgi:hypothetical protein